MPLSYAIGHLDDINAQGYISLPPLLLSLDITRPMQNNLQRSFPDWSQRCQHHALRRAPDHRTLVLLDHEAGVLLALVFDLRNGGRQGDG